ncbi:MAG: tRNA dihydrouridine synthase DusB [Candidatus Omnitrophica bacterium]|nr:tRNA dihydrouridine synthase DusB [Candidatus Omnitrophota bacterium]
MFEIGPLTIHSRLILAPLAGISDLPFRLINRRFGCELAFVEMINARSLGYRSMHTARMLATTPQDRPLGVQLLGCEPAYILRALDILKNYKFDILDFNAACPMRKVVRRGEGAGLLREPRRLGELLKLVVDNSQAPVTVKIRIGWDATCVNAREVALYAQDAGVRAVCIHGRTRAQVYSGRVDYQTIRQVKKALSIPVIASGDIFSPLLAKKMFDETGCDAINIARGALGNPWIFRQVQQYLETGSVPAKPSRQETTSLMQEHLRLCVDFYGQRNGVVIFRKFFTWYTRGMRRIRPLREKAYRIRTLQEMSGAIEKLNTL